MRTINKLRYILTRKQKWELVGMTILIVIGSALELLGVTTVLPVVLAIMQPETLVDQKYFSFIYRFFHLSSPLQLALLLIVLLIFVYIVKNAYLIFMYSRQYKFVYKNLHILSDQMMNCYLHQPYLFHVSKNSAELLRNINVDAGNFYGVIQAGIQLATEGMVCGTLFIYLLIQDKSITLALLVLILIMLLLFTKVYKKILFRLGQKSRYYFMEVNKWVQQGLGGIKEIKVLNQEDFFYRQFDGAYAGHADTECTYHSLVSIPKPLLETVCIGGLLGTVGIKVIMGADLDYFLPILTVFAVAAMRMLPSFNRITDNLSTVMYQKASVDAVYEDLKEIERLSRERQRQSQGGEISFTDAIVVRDLSFTYPNTDKRVLDHVNLTINKNTSVAFIGQSGAGKTTLADVILGILEPQEGEILVGGRNIFRNLDAWHRKIGYIPQSIYLLDDTIERNIAFGIAKEQIDPKRMEYAIERAQLKGMIEQLPEGLMTEIGEGGVRLSGGQRQRIGIARALYHEPEILILDEATSALDNETEAAVMEAIESLHGEMTLLIIAHRLSTIQHCDVVYEIRDGEAVQTACQSGQSATIR
ncbi:MAG: ABC transporter ATP-binding protein [Eubacteriales bacterium]|nr:ABC transporter ATP-binding protein [Eubacteriales bacterium]